VRPRVAHPPAVSVAAYHHGGCSSAFSQLSGCGAFYPGGAPHTQIPLHPRPRPCQHPSKFADAVLPPGIPRAPAREHPVRGAGRDRVVPA
jgi:hypothetical protein